MKYVVLLCDGMADTPVPALGNKTPMEAAHKPSMDALAAKSELGIAHTVPASLPAGSDVAHLSVLGYDPTACYTGRSPLEAASIGVSLADDDLALRCNFVTLTEEADYADKHMADYCAGDISTREADLLIQALQEQFGGGDFDFYTGTAYRHCLVWHHQTGDIGKLTPPHDITGRRIGEHLPPETAAPLLRIMEQSMALLADHPVNRARRERGLAPANAVWFWGQGSRPRLTAFETLYGLKGAMISAVDLLKGIGILSGMKVCRVDGATGYIDTNFAGKREAAVQALRDGCDLAYIHVEAPDECGHRGEAENKKRAIELIDREILTPLLSELRAMDDFSLLICPDHPTPLATRTHSHDPIPYLIYRSNAEQDSGLSCFSEKTARSTGIVRTHGYELMQTLTGKGQA